MVNNETVVAFTRERWLVGCCRLCDGVVPPEKSRLGKDGHYLLAFVCHLRIHVDYVFFSLLILNYGALVTQQTRAACFLH